MIHSPHRRWLCGAAVLLVGLGPLALTGCGSTTTVDPGGGPELPQASLSARIAVADPIETLDPLYASSRSERMVSRQIFEPLSVSTLPPFGSLRGRRGPARVNGPDGNATQWEFQLRPGVVFGDGRPLDFEAVGLNVQRWLSSGIAAKLLPELESVDNPRPGRVRFILNEPVDDFPSRLANPRFGLVSPALIRARGTDPITEGYAGTGPFELRELSPESALQVASADWWGRDLGLGPGVERLQFSVVPTGVARLGLLRSVSVEVADEISPQAVPSLQRDPLLTTVDTGPATIGLQRSVRGVNSSRAPQQLSGLWLTTLR